MNPLNTDLPVIHLKPGELYFSEKPELIFTLLGSCISIIMYSPRYRQAAICHSLLPQDLNSCEGKSKAGNFKYLDQSFNTMYDWFIRRGIKNHEITVKVFGGGDVIQGKGSGYGVDVNNKTVGARNIDAALTYVRGKNLNVAAVDVGGESGRQVFLYSHTGEVLLKRLKKTETTFMIMQQEGDTWRNRKQE